MRIGLDTTVTGEASIQMGRTSWSEFLNLLLLRTALGSRLWPLLRPVLLVVDSEPAGGSRSTGVPAAQPPDRPALLRLLGLLRPRCEPERRERAVCPPYRLAYSGAQPARAALATNQRPRIVTIGPMMAHNVTPVITLPEMTPRP